MFMSQTAKTRFIFQLLPFFFPLGVLNISSLISRNAVSFTGSMDDGASSGIDTSAKGCSSVVRYIEITMMKSSLYMPNIKGN